MLPKANFPDPLIQERRRRLKQYFLKALVSPLSVVLWLASIALALINPLLILAGWAAVIAIAYFRVAGRAESEWWGLLADRLEMNVDTASDLLPATPLLRSGDEREVDRAMADDTGRRLAQYCSTDVTHNSKGEREEHHHRYTVVFTVDAAVVRFLSAHEHTFSAMKWLGDDHRGRIPADVDEFKCESVELHEKFELRTSNEDGAKAREIFSPTFILWFIKNGIEFEYENGALAVFADRTLDHADEYAMLLRRAETIRSQLAGGRPALT